MTIVTFASEHGGVATTTSAVTIAYKLAQEGQQTLLLDLDSQGHCAFSLGLDAECSVYDWLVCDQPWVSQIATIDSNGLCLMRGDSTTKSVDGHYHNLADGWERLVNKIREVNIDGWVIIDSPRGGMLSDAAIAVADVIVIPFRGDSLSLVGVYHMLPEIEVINPEAEIILLPTIMVIHEKESRNALEEMQNYLPKKVALPIPKRVAVAAATSNRKTIWDFDADGIADVRNAYSALMERLMPKEVPVEHTDEILHYQQMVAELQNQLDEANAWRARHELQGRMDALESRLESLEGTIAEISGVAHPLTGKVGKIAAPA